MKENKLHYNYPQIRSALVAAPEEWLVAGRGIGKSEGVLAPASINRFLNEMPRSCGINVGATFTQLLTRTLPALFYGWEKLGYKRGEHYLVGEKPSAKWIKQWNWKGPFRAPLKYDYFVSWWNGSGMHLVSQDRPGSSNGVTIDWIIGDEAKLLNREKLVGELFPANRGIIHDFKDSPYHHGKIFTTDMPVGTSGRWILDKSEEMNKEIVQEILNLKQMVYLLQLEQRSHAKSAFNKYQKDIDLIESEITKKRFGLLYYHEASTLENIHALGFDYIKQQLRDSSIFEFDTQILNKRPLKLEDGFYPDLDEEKHGYFSYDYKFIDDLQYDFNKLNVNDCRRDADVDYEMPMHISMDYNRRIFPLEVAQLRHDELRVINSFHVLYPLKSKDVLQQFVDYYKFHKNKTIYYWYDHTAIAEQDYTPVADSVVRFLESKGWRVIRMYIKHGLTHEARYRMFGHLLQEDGTYNKKLRMNRDNCKYLFLSMYQAGAELRKEGFGKNKKPESDPKFPAEEATHHSEALDVMVTGIFESKLDVYQPGEYHQMHTL